ncbi:hypothetical protein RHGRI_034136 [Rhododendron griersonianum]|uniref:Uncharacterized protein n=1 Tax=Rhododendron griersonianum TaxID=479676 RepID=A0AAV6HZB9_9ERIC|nr:hypothetical protein RHGRI_034136 [Rhododendron griersonianum]
MRTNSFNASGQTNAGIRHPKEDEISWSSPQSSFTKLLPANLRDIDAMEAGEYWVLFKTGWKIFPVRVVNKKLHKGWVQFWIKHKLQPNFRLLFAAEQKWIFDVIILDKQLRCVDYNWVTINNELDIVPAMPGEYALTELLSKDADNGRLTSSTKGCVSTNCF